MELRKFRTLEEKEAAHRRDYSNFPILWAFSNEQFLEGAKRLWGYDIKNPNDKEKFGKLVPLGAGGYILKKDVQAYKSLCERQVLEDKAFAEDFDNLVKCIIREMCNHEYAYTMDPDDTLTALGSVRDLENFSKAWAKAEKKVMKEASHG